MTDPTASARWQAYSRALSVMRAGDPVSRERGLRSYTHFCRTLPPGTDARVRADRLVRSLTHTVPEEPVTRPAIPSRFDEGRRTAMSRHPNRSRTRRR